MKFFRLFVGRSYFPPFHPCAAAKPATQSIVKIVVINAIALHQGVSLIAHMIIAASNAAAAFSPFVSIPRNFIIISIATFVSHVAASADSYAVA